jgi:hypothetical protein
VTPVRRPTYRPPAADDRADCEGEDRHQACDDRDIADTGQPEADGVVRGFSATCTH